MEKAKNLDFVWPVSVNFIGWGVGRLDALLHANHFTWTHGCAGEVAVNCGAKHLY